VVDVLVFSKDRPAQLDLLLRSIDRHALSLYSSVTILYTATLGSYYRGYDLIQDERPGVRWHWDPAQGFETTVRNWLSVAGDVVSFLVDDDVFYRDTPATGSVLSALTPCSLRGGDYDYPFSVDGNIYRRDNVLELLELFNFSNPTELEARAHALRAILPFAELVPVEPPCLVGVPANRVSVSSGMPHMGVDPFMLNERFLNGERLVARFDRDRYPAHWPVEYDWETP